MNPQQDRAGHICGGSINVYLNFEVADALVDKRHESPLAVRLLLFVLREQFGTRGRPAEGTERQSLHKLAPAHAFVHVVHDVALVF
jgi:hypothetical protein